MRWHEKFCPALIAPSPGRKTPLPTVTFVNKIAANVPNNMAKGSHFSSFASFSIVSLTPIYKPDSSRDLTIFMISCISLFESCQINQIE